MARVADQLWTLEEFLAFDDGTDTSYQLLEGRLVAMNPRCGHGGLVVRLAASISSQLRPPCEAYAEAGIVPVNRHSWYKADLIVTCTPGSYKDPFHRRADTGHRGPVADDHRHRLQPQAPRLSADPVDARRAAGSSMERLISIGGVSGRLDGAPASARRHGPPERRAGHRRNARAVRRNPARLRAPQEQGGKSGHD